MRESGEMYLETILTLLNENKRVRAIDVAEEMKLSKASVSRALAHLRAENCITVHPDGSIAFTDTGYAVAEKIYERHHVLTNMLISLGVSEETAARDACKIEHDISDETFSRIKEHMNRGTPVPKDASPAPEP